MKTFSLQGIILGILSFIICSCSTQDDSLNVKSQSASKTKKEPALTCEKLFNSPDKYMGQVINLDAINWGSSESVDGEEILMSLNDEKLVGLQQAHVLVHFTKDQEKDIEHFKENDSISLTAKVDTFRFGALRLIEAKVKPN